MTTARSVRARTAAGLVVTIAVCLSAPVVASPSQLTAPGHARLRGTGPSGLPPSAHPRTVAPAPAHATTPVAPAATPAPGAVTPRERPARLHKGPAPRRLSAPGPAPLRASAPAHGPAKGRSPLRAPRQRQRTLEPRHGAAGGGAARGPSATARQGQGAGPSSKRASSNVRAGTRQGASAAGEGSARTTAGASAQAKLKPSTTRRSRSTTTRRAKAATGALRGRHRGTARESTTGGNAPASAPASATTAIAPAIAGAPFAPTPAGVSLVPQIAGIVSQPVGPGAPRGASARPPAGVAAGSLLAGASAAAAATGAAAQPPATVAPRLRRIASRGPARRQSTGNLLDVIRGNITLPGPVRLPDWSIPIIVALLIIALWFGVRSRVAGVRARRLERQRASLLSDLGAMQAALVPEVPRRLGPLEVSVAYRPAEGPAAGGDFYDVFEPRPGQIAVVLGDVAGHGHEALKHAALTHFTLRAYLQAGLEPRAALALAGQVLSDPTGERYSTVAVAVYDTASSTLTYALAGHPPPILLGYPAHEPVTACSSPPVGWGIPTGRRQTTVSLPAGAIACFFSDGLIEARREGQLLGRGQLREILTGLGERPDATDLLAEVRAAAQGAPDDMVACVLSPASSRVGSYLHVEELEADTKTLARPAVGRFLRECMVPPAEAKRALAHARQIASNASAALLRVRFEADATTVYVAPIGRAGRRGSDDPQVRRMASVDESLLETLVTG